ncbi:MULTISPECIES: exopolysaccharide biosynthesis protein [unclassified Mesorhizobium]|uniref:exopolysaccharide biosynthesis protein n=1 Tax=unclassified Mesorhizobium TaxID=325217 RepID=UPI001928D38C|nr:MULTISPECIES: exopolysaccharide biosynthesis protein [unclassified Mesorhizobium]
MRQEIAGHEGDGIGAPRRRRPRRLSQIFEKIAREAEGRVSLASIRDGLGDRSFAALLVLFAAFNMIPLPPGASAVLGLPMVIVAAQMTLGSRRAWLPGFVMNRSISAEQFRTVIDWAVPRLVRLEDVIRPRYWPFWRRRGERVVGFVALIMAIVVTLPIPFGNWLPACTTALLGLSLVERDGILLAIGGAVGIAALAVTFFVVGAAGVATHAALGWMF